MVVCASRAKRFCRSPKVTSSASLPVVVVVVATTAVGAMTAAVVVAVVRRGVTAVTVRVGNVRGAS